ncbi:MAG: hypothetical protein M1608_14810 [Candidatus Omnitrophica bacterium]|nr:hypothetical protein [Candidatus Omnitrophota bacterium]
MKLRQICRLDCFRLIPVACVLLLSVSPARSAAAESADADLEARFMHPPAESRILKIIHSWPDDPQAQDQLITRLTQQGFGGVVCNVSFRDYLESEQKWNAFKRAVAEAKKAGMSMWLYDEKGYPSGNAGGIVLKGHPEWEAHGLLIADAAVDSGEVTLDVPPGASFLAAAYPVENGEINLDKPVDLSAFIREGRLHWQAPSGQWRVMVITESRLYDGTHAALSLADKLPYINLLQREPTARFLDATHRQYAEHLGPDLGKWFVSTFTDEPSLMSFFLRPMPYRVLPWAPNLPVEFKKRRGYDLEPWIPALVASAGPKGRKARYDFWKTVGELVSENFFGQIQQWCGQHRVLSGGHLLMEENLVSQVALYGDFFRCIRRLDAPSIDCLTSLPADGAGFIARLLSSAAELENKTVTMSETSDHVQRYRPRGDSRPVRVVTEAEIRGTCNRLIAGGINTITSYYAFAGLNDDTLRRLNDWIGRCCFMLKGGNQVADIAVLYPVDSLWPRFVPSRLYVNDSSADAQIEHVFRSASDSLFIARRDFTYVDGQALCDARVEGDALVSGPLKWRVVVLPAADTLPLAAWENLARFVRGGGALIALSSLPANCENEFPSRRVRELADEIFGQPTGQPCAKTNADGGNGIFLPAGLEALLPGVVNRLLEPDLKAAGARAQLRVTHRHINGHEVYFVINDSPRAWAGQISLSAEGTGEQWDPATGHAQSLADNKDIELKLEPYGGALFRFDKRCLPKRLSVSGTPLPRLVHRALPTMSPTVARGEFVRETLEPDSRSNEQNGPVWRARASLTKGQVDTFLFLRFTYPQSVDLRRARCLVADTWIPEGQNTPSQLLAVIHEKDGADYLASTGRPLGVPGFERVYVPWSEFKLAGWSSDPNGRLDRDQITEIRFGWGGYYGSEGEQIEFSLRLPELVETSQTSLSR